MGLLKTRGTFLGIPKVRIIVLIIIVLIQNWDSAILGNYNII